MLRETAKRAVAVAAFLAVATASAPAWAQHGWGHGGHGHHYGGHHAFDHYGGFGVHFSQGHHYYPQAYGYNYYAVPRVYTYSQRGTANADSPSRQGTTSEGLRSLRRAESTFRSHHYNDAIDWARRAAREMPRDGRVFLLLSQAHLAVGEYREAAGAARQGMSLLPPDDWGYLVRNFRRYYHDNDYANQVRRLERFVKDSPNDVDARFLLGYHWVFLGHPSAANRQLAKAAELNPRGEWSNRLLALVGGATPRRLPGPSSDPLPPNTPGDHEGRVATDEHRHDDPSRKTAVVDTEPGPGPTLTDYAPPSGPVERFRGSGREQTVPK